MGVVQGKAIVITGAGRGIGAACAIRAAAEGASVVVNDINQAGVDAVCKEISGVGGRAVGHVGDISSWSEAEKLIAHCVSAFGAIDGLVNNAGIANVKLAVDLSEAEVRAMLDINLFASIACLIHAAKQMIRQGRGGAIVNMSSGIQAGFVAQSIYGATKGGLASMTYAMALELAPHAIRVNAVSPMARGSMRDQVDTYYRAHNVANRPTGDIGPEPAANTPLMLYLLSDLSSAINGQLVRIDGDELALMTHPAILTPVLKRDEWTIEAIRDAFERDLGKRLQKVGPARVRVQPE